MAFNINSNMAYRQFLTTNANQIITNSQNAVQGKCKDILPLSSAPLPSSPVLFFSVVENPMHFDPPSDLKDNFLKQYITTAQLSTPVIRY